MSWLIDGRIALVLALVMSCGCDRSTTKDSQPQKAGPESVTEALLVNADHEPGNWLTYGRTYNEQRLSLLMDISD